MRAVAIFSGGAALAAVAAGFWILWPDSAEAEPGLLPYNDPASVAAGMVLYRENCASCHGLKLEGQPNWQSPDSDGYLPAPPHDETGHTWHHADALLYSITKFGTAKVVGGDYKSNMAGFTDILSDSEILATLAYIKSTWSRQLKEMHNTVNKNAEFAN